MEQNIRERLDALREKMVQEQIDYYLIPTADYHNSEYVSDYFKVREYFSGFTGSNGTLVVGRNIAGLWTDGRYFIQAEKELAGSGIKLFRMMEEGVPSIKEYLQQSMQDGEVLGFDGKVVTASYARELEAALSDKKIVFCYEKDIAGSLWKDRPQMPAGVISVLPEELCGQNPAEKLEAIRAQMKELHCEVHLLGKLDDLMWIFNIRGSDVECNPVALSYGFLTMRECYLFVQKQAVDEKMQQYAQKWGITLKDYGEIGAFLETYDFSKKPVVSEETDGLDKKVFGRKERCNVLLDDKNISMLLYQIVKQKADIVSGANPSENLKAVKNPVELAHMREVYLKDSVTLTKFIFWLKKNIGKIPMDEYSVAMRLDGMRRQMEGFLDLSFPTISAYKENAAMMHYEATETNHKKLEPEGMLLVDSGGQYLGGTTDVTRTIVLGEVKDEVKKHFTAVAVGMLRLTNTHFLYGCTGRNLDIMARESLWRMGIDYKCGTGHGIGYILNVHEGPQNIRWRYTEGSKEAVIEAGMVMSNEPGVYIEGSHGIRTENIIVAENGVKNADGQFMHFETLTFVPIDLEAIDSVYMQPEEIAQLNSYHKNVYEKLTPYLDEEERSWLKDATREIS